MVRGSPPCALVECDLKTNKPKAETIPLDQGSMTSILSIQLQNFVFFELLQFGEESFEQKLTDAMERLVNRVTGDPCYDFLNIFAEKNSAKKIAVFGSKQS
jgi:hypothetical protein